MDKAERKRRYYLKNKDHILFYQRGYKLKYGNNRKYYRNTNIQSQMPVDLFMMRNEQRFREGFNLIESE